jgi:hypothetical protein
MVGSSNTVNLHVYVGYICMYVRIYAGINYIYVNVTYVSCVMGSNLQEN